MRRDDEREEGVCPLPPLLLLVLPCRTADGGVRGGVSTLVA